MSKGKFFGNKIVDDAEGKPIYAKTKGQHDLVKSIEENDIIFVNGPAGTGKTFIAACKAVAGLDRNKFDRIVLTRPAVESGEELGFLPGTMEEKIGPYMRPLYDSIERLRKKPAKKPRPSDGGKAQRGQPSRKKTKLDNIVPDEVEEWMKNIEIAPLAYMRGATHAKSFVILDEAQNVTPTQMKMFLTRMGEGSKVVITGDASQTDLNRRVGSGFRHAQRLLSGVKGIGFVTLDERDIVRHKLVKDIILRYEKEESYKSHTYSNKGPNQTPLFEADNTIESNDYREEFHEDVEITESNDNYHSFDNHDADDRD
jgi:phosphate starvation-inducible PhoH-like protein